MSPPYRSRNRRLNPPRPKWRASHLCRRRNQWPVSQSLHKTSPCTPLHIRVSNNIIPAKTRLGILDASEIPPTFAAPPGQFLGLIAGGDAAIRRAQEGAEDSIPLGEADMASLDLNPESDSVIGIAASGRTPYVLGCISFAKRIIGCVTIGVVCADPSALGASGDVDFLIAPLPGPEVVSGSTRLKAGTATKLVLNMLSTGTMIRVGKTFGNTVTPFPLLSSYIVG
jgi:N-acetylmuramic acid 6-phosphate etherase